MPDADDQSPNSARPNYVDALIERIDPWVLEAVVRIAADLARDGVEGRSVGATFVVGDTAAVLERSDPLILDPLSGHSREDRDIRRPAMEGTLHELAQLDGAFVVSADGVVVSAARCLDVSAGGVSIPLGLGSRHRAAASISKVTRAVVVVVSSNAVVRIFCDGRVVDEQRFGRRPVAARRIVDPRVPLAPLVPASLAECVKVPLRRAPFSILPRRNRIRF